MIRGMLREIFWYGEEGQVASLAALCPACGFEHSFNVDLESHGKWTDDQSVWTFNGNYDCPTFSPSIVANLHRQKEYHPVCHSFLKNGIWEYLNDSSHNMAGQNVPMVVPDPDATFEKRHGWHLFPWTDDEGRQRKENK